MIKEKIVALGAVVTIAVVGLAIAGLLAFATKSKAEDLPYVNEEAAALYECGKEVALNTFRDVQFYKMADIAADYCSPEMDAFHSTVSDNATPLTEQERYQIGLIIVGDALHRGLKQLVVMVQEQVQKELDSMPSNPADRNHI